jgi:hypothetical protein
MAFRPILNPFDIFYLWLFGIHIIPVLVCFTKKNLATLPASGEHRNVRAGRFLKQNCIPELA